MKQEVKKQEMKKRKSHLDEVVRKVREYDDMAVITQLEQYGIAPSDYEVELNVYHSEERRGVPYLALLIRKALPPKQQAELAQAINEIDSTLCVIFKQ